MSRSSYVSDMRSLTVIMTALGWMSSQERNNVMQVRVWSWRFCYSACLVSLQLTLALKLMFDSLQLVPSLSPHTQNIAYIFVLAKTFPHLVPMLVLVQARQQANFCNVWASLQRKIEVHGISRERVDVKLKNVVVRRISFILLLTSFVVLFRSLKFSKLPMLHNASLVLGFINESLVFTWWYYTCEATRHVSARLLHEFMLLLEFNETGDTGSLLSEAALGLRGPWLQLCRVMQIFGDPLSLVQSFIVIFSFARILFAAYVVCTAGDTRVISLYASLFLISVTSLNTVCQATHRLETQIHLDLLQAMQKLKRLRISRAARQSVTLALSQFFLSYQFMVRNINETQN